METYEKIMQKYKDRLDEMTGKAHGFIKDMGGVSFVELDRFMKQSKLVDKSFGTVTMVLQKFPNVVIWVTQNALTYLVFSELVRSNKIRITGYGAFTHICYLQDDGWLNMPIANGPYDYKKPHWLPITFSAVQSLL